MSKTRKFVSLIEVKQREEREKVRQLTASARKEADAKAMLERLDSYLSDYSHAKPADSANPASAAQLRSNRAFVTRLQASVEQQRKHVRHAADATRARSHDWRQAKNETRRLDRLAQRTHESEERVRQRHERNEDDEVARIACQRHGVRSTDSDSSTFDSPPQPSGNCNVARRGMDD